MKYFYIIANYTKEYAKQAQEKICTYLEQRGALCQVLPPLGEDREQYCRYLSQIPEQTQCIITIGGDGTLIRAARNLAGRDIPMVGVNRGYLGFLNQVSRREDMAPVLDALLEDRYQLERRMMIRGTAYRGEKKLMEDIALNEISVARKGSLKALRLSVYVNEEYLNEYSADGILVATPTGSTAYNLSAGGPVISPAAQMMVLTPICAHALNVRSIVLGPEDRIRIDMTGSGQAAAFDGDTFIDLEPGDSIQIQRAETSTIMVRLKHISFMQNLSNHLAGRG